MYKLTIGDSTANLTAGTTNSSDSVIVTDANSINSYIWQPTEFPVVLLNAFVKEPLDKFLPIKAFEFTVEDDVINDKNQPIEIIEFGNGSPAIRYWLCSCTQPNNFNIELLTNELKNQFLLHYVGYHATPSNRSCLHIKEVMKQRICIKAL